MSTRPTRRRLITGAAGATALGAVSMLTAPGAAAHEGRGEGRGKGGRRKGRKGGALIGQVRRDHIHVMSFNIRYDRDGTEPGDPDFWPERRPGLIELLETEEPTVLGIQEALFHQLEAVSEGLGDDYDMVGYGRDGGSQGEYSAIYFDADRFELRAWDQFWLSDTPDVIGSATWGNTVTRIAVWARLADRTTGRELIVLNTHFDHESQNARVRSAELVTATLEEVGADLPVLITGDFNAPAGDSEAYTALVDDAGFRDTWTAAEEQLTPAWGTFPGYEEPIEGGERIDWVLAGGDVTVHEAAINMFREDGRFPSDHAPVQALVTLG